jgi:hypothetical protein
LFILYLHCLRLEAVNTGYVLKLLNYLHNSNWLLIKKQE